MQPYGPDYATHTTPHPENKTTLKRMGPHILDEHLQSTVLHYIVGIFDPKAFIKLVPGTSVNAHSPTAAFPAYRKNDPNIESTDEDLPAHIIIIYGFKITRSF